MEKEELIDILTHTTQLVCSRCVMLECLCEGCFKTRLLFYLPVDYDNLLEELASRSLSYSIVHFRVNKGDGIVNKYPDYAIFTLVEQEDHSTNIDADVIQSIMQHFDWAIKEG
jgi:hypothetical protein